MVEANFTDDGEKQGRRKQLLIGPAKGMAVKEKCAKHTQHANARGVWGHAPQEIFEKTCSEIASDSFLSQNLLPHNYIAMCVNFLSIHVQ